MFLREYWREGEPKDGEEENSAAAPGRRQLCPAVCSDHRMFRAVGICERYHESDGQGVCEDFPHDHD